MFFLKNCTLSTKAHLTTNKYYMSVLNIYFHFMKVIPALKLSETLSEAEWKCIPETLSSQDTEAKATFIKKPQCQQSQKCTN